LLAKDRYGDFDYFPDKSLPGADWPQIADEYDKV